MAVRQTCSQAAHGAASHLRCLTGCLPCLRSGLPSPRKVSQKACRRGYLARGRASGPVANRKSLARGRAIRRRRSWVRGRNACSRDGYDSNFCNKNRKQRIFRPILFHDKTKNKPVRDFLFHENEVRFTYEPASAPL